MFLIFYKRCLLINLIILELAKKCLVRRTIPKPEDAPDSFRVVFHFFSDSSQ